ncbi:hypothetical protein [Kitasatospora sp. CB02891]|uniref:hypothetical protein n=1 Tax=Kitasatospora sp. CB02891 TaxID=2020329 RepID=UPI000C275ABE|nr:hypothetical protein [Kitasatospora sp. CB02891]PJN24035.1 hypothetical protein CG736_19245 [Kitasatospora sp. CB02891]
MSTPQSADAFLMGGGGAPTAKFPAPGSKVEGFITEPPTVQQQRDPADGKPKFWTDGNPMMQLVVTVQTVLRDPAIQEDDGRRRIFVKGQMKQAVQDAVKQVAAPGLEVGGYLAVTYTHDGQKTNNAFNAPKQYRAEYTRAAAAELQRPDPTAAYGLAPAPQQAYASAVTAPAAPAVPGLTAEQIAAAQANPAAAALLAQLQQNSTAPAQPAGQLPPF